MQLQTLDPVQTDFGETAGRSSRRPRSDGRAGRRPFQRFIRNWRLDADVVHSERRDEFRRAADR